MLRNGNFVCRAVGDSEEKGGQKRGDSQRCFRGAREYVDLLRVLVRCCGVLRDVDRRRSGL